MLEKKEERSTLSRPTRKKKYLYLDKFEAYKLSNDEKLRLIKRALKGVYVVLGGMFMAALVTTLYYLFK